MSPDAAEGLRLVVGQEMNAVLSADLCEALRIRSAWLGESEGLP
jgi:hypothetical protein